MILARKWKIQWFYSEFRHVDCGINFWKSVKFRQKLVKFQHESAQTLNNFDDVVWNIVWKISKIRDENLLEDWGLSGAKAFKSCRSRQELSNEYLLAKIGFDTAENEPFNFHNFSSLQGFNFHGAVVSPAQQRATPVDDEVLGAHTRWL